MDASPSPIRAQTEPYAPRYGCYPTVSQFRSDVGDAAFRSWCGDLIPGARLALSLHVPYCERLCRFCICRTQAVRTQEPVLAYLAALEAEIERLGRLLPAGVCVDRMQWRGGTPTILRPEGIAALNSRIRRALPVAPALDFEVEIEPHGVETAKFAALAEAGLTWARIGLQDFDPQVQRAIGRDQDRERVTTTFAALRGRGVSIAVDLLYGLPRQTRDSIVATCGELTRLRPDRIALIAYAHVPRMAKRQRAISEADLPDALARRDQFSAAARELRSAGYVRSGVGGFAQADAALCTAAREASPGVHGAADGEPDAVIGLGAGSISRFVQGYVQNVSGTGAYLARAAHGAADRGVALGLEDRVRKRAIEMLLCDLRIDMDRLRSEFGDFARVLDRAVAAATERFAVVIRAPDGGLILPDDDDPMLARRVARLFDGYASD